MFRTKRADTLVGTIEDQYNIDLHARRDMRLENLLAQRGFESLSQLLDAYYGRLRFHARPRRAFLSYHYEDRTQVAGFRLMIHNDRVVLELRDLGLTQAVQSENQSYVRQAIREKIRRAEIIICLIGNGTAWREFVDWELQTGLELGKGLCGVRLKQAYGRTPPLLKEERAPIAPWDVMSIVTAIEQAAARRS
jgi:hypothetical protein